MNTQPATFAAMKPWLTLPIRDCAEPLRTIPLDRLAFFDPHAYVCAGAPYGGISPWQLRESVLEALLTAQDRLSAARPGWRFKLFDAYRPTAVQAYMVEREFHQQAQKAGLDPLALDEAQRATLAPAVFRLWSLPSEDPATPPLHSTGAALDVTLVDADGVDVSMGSPLDENSPRSDPDHFAEDTSAAGRQAHANRQFLYSLLLAQGFRRHPTEWWHFSIGDQLWAWLVGQEGGTASILPIYGRADLAGAL
jgi:D-alanyl-D-alanine dipeptidase